MMERRLKLGGISRMFGLSFFSCRNRVDASVMAQDPIFISHRDSHAYPDLLNPAPPMKRSFPSLCRSKKPMITSDHQARSVSEKKLCPPAPPTSPLLNSWCRNNIVMEETDEKGKREKKKKTREKKKKTRKKKRSASKRFLIKGKECFETTTMIPSTSSADSYCFFSSSEEEGRDQVETLFSRKSFSSDSSSESHRRRRLRRRRALRRQRRKNKVPSRKENPSKYCCSDDAELPQITGGRALPIKGGFAVVKRSKDPHADFRSSMVEMIMEKQIFGARELEQLLYCFLSLNSPSHHHAIVDVFEEICEALFTTWS